MRVISGPWIVCVFFLMLAGCTAPRALSDKELAAQGSTFWAGLQESAQQATTPVTLDRAIALALQNNLEFRVHALESAIATGNRQLASVSMLPALTAQAGYHDRNNVLASSSENIANGTVSLVPSTSSQMRGHTESLIVGWNMLDFGLQYFRARQYGEQAFIAEEERRKAIQTITRDVVYYWWMARGYEELQPEIEATQQELEQALRSANSLAQQRLNNPVDFLEYNKALYLIMKRLDRLVLEMNQARSELARLLGLPAGIPLKLSDSDTPLNSLVLPDISLEQWQMAALVYRPEMRQALYRARISREEAASFWLGLLPAMQVGYGSYHDSNAFLINNNWNEFSAQVSWNLMRLATIPAGRKIQKLNRELAQEQARLQAAAVLSQVAIAASAVRFADHSACISRNLAEVDSKRLAIIRAKAGAAVIDRLSLIRAKVDNLLLRAEQATDTADYQRARASLLASVGIGIAPDHFSSGELAAVEEDLRGWWQNGVSARVQEAMTLANKNVALPAPDASKAPVGGIEESELCL